MEDLSVMSSTWKFKRPLPYLAVLRNLKRGWSPRAYLVPRLEGGDGFDIVIRVDGPYVDKEVAEEMCELWTSELHELLNNVEYVDE
jgi:CRISPR/Cas system endoribonuclease Cas6 (RAMP superfamily)